MCVCVCVFITINILIKDIVFQGNILFLLPQTVKWEGQTHHIWR